MIERLPLEFNADANKVLLRYLDLGIDRLNELVNQVEKMSEQKMEMIWAETTSLFAHRHRNYLMQLEQHTRLVEDKLGKKLRFIGSRRHLLGAYVTKEYSTQAAALFNPSIVMHPNQQENANGAQRFIMSLRATGEGHISSMVFKEGVIEKNGHIIFGPDTIWQTAGDIGFSSDRVEHTDDRYEVSFSRDIPINERVIFPYAQSESMGMEDVRLVRFVDRDRTTYLGTYTAYDGENIRSKILETDDFLKFKFGKLSGSAIKGKGMALFPRKIRGQYAAIGRQDGVAMTLMYSDHFLTWDSVLPLQDPEEPFELIQVGNCGSPIETEEGWLLLTHSVGPMRRYTIGVSLLDLDYPEKLIGKLKVPLMQPEVSEREGYVPNVLYTCGWLKHGKEIIVPYAMSDAACGFAKLNIQDLLTELTSS